VMCLLVLNMDGIHIACTHACAAAGAFVIDLDLKSFDPGIGS